MAGAAAAGRDRSRIPGTLTRMRWRGHFERPKCEMRPTSMRGRSCLRQSDSFRSPHGCCASRPVSIKSMTIRPARSRRRSCDGLVRVQFAPRSAFGFANSSAVRRGRDHEGLACSPGACRRRRALHVATRHRQGRCGDRQRGCRGCRRRPRASSTALWVLGAVRVAQQWWLPPKRSTCRRCTSWLSVPRPPAAVAATAVVEEPAWIESRRRRQPQASPPARATPPFGSFDGLGADDIRVLEVAPRSAPRSLGWG